MLNNVRVGGSSIGMSCNSCNLFLSVLIFMSDEIISGFLVHIVAQLGLYASKGFDISSSMS